MKRITIVMLAIVASFLMSSSIFAASGKVLNSLCNDEKYFCIKTIKGETWESLFVDQQTRELVMRLNRMNIQLRPGMVIAVPSEVATTTIMEHAPFAKQIEPTHKKLVVFDPNLHAWGAYDVGGKLVRWGPAAGGKSWCPDVNSSCYTVVGKYTVYRKGGAECKSNKFPLPNGGAPMQYCMFFKGGYALHASNDVPGYNASHGCVRMYLEDARWLNQEFIELPDKNNPNSGTDVLVMPYEEQINQVQST